ncbi:MAG: hypothetical protein KAJ49_03390 [Arcobacteraceae bacterium]|nr:hypothetical protein [Arcobacteraceae bacterium]
MVKFSEQILARQQEVKEFDISQLTRTQRRQYVSSRDKEIARRTKLFGEAKAKVKDMSFEEYKKYYPTMEDWLQGSFASPQVIEAEQQREINLNISRADKKIESYKVNLKQQQDAKAEHYRWWGRKSSDYQSERGDDFKEDIKEYEDDIDKWQGYINEWESAKTSYLSKGYGYNEVRDYVDSKVDYQVARAEAKRDAQKRSTRAYQKLLVSPQAKVFKKAQAQYKGKIDWSDPRNVQQILEQEYISTYGVEKFLERETRGLTPIQTKTGLITFKTPTGKEKFTLFRGQTGQVVFRELGRGTAGIKRFQYEVPKPTTTTPSAIVETPPLILQEAQAPFRYVGSETITKTKLPDVDKIVEEATGKVKKKKKFGIKNLFKILGVPVGALQVKTNPSFPTKPTDRLTTIKGVAKEITKPEFRQILKQDVPKFLRATTIRPYEELGRGAKALYKRYVPKKKEKITIKELPPVSPTKPTPPKLTPVSKPQLPKREYDLAKYNLYKAPTSQKMVYLPKGAEAPKEYQGYKPVEKLGWKAPTEKEIEEGKEGRLQAFKRDEEIPKDFVRISPTSLKRVFGKQGLEEGQYMKSIKKTKAKQPLWKKPILAVAPSFTYTDPFGLKTATIGWGNIVHKATKGKYGYSDKELRERLEKRETEFWTKRAISKTGEKVKPFGKFYIESPVAQASLIYGATTFAGATISATAPILPTKITALAVAKPTIIGGKVLFAGLVGYSGRRTIKRLREAEAPVEEYVSALGTQAVFIGAGVKGFQTGLKHPFPLRLGKVAPQVPTGKMVTQKIWKAGERVKVRVPETKEVALWRGAYYVKPSGKVSVLIGRTKVPTTIAKTGIPSETYTTKFVTGFPKKFAYPKGTFAEGYVPATQIETTFAKQYIGRFGTATQQKLVGSALFVRRGTEFVKVKPIGFEEFKSVEAMKGLTPAGKKALVKWIKSQKGDYMVYGSSTVKARAGAILKRPIHDIDMQFAKAKGTTKAEQLMKILKKTGSKVTLDPTTKTQIMVKIKGKATKLMDIHGYDAPEISQEQIYGFKYQPPTRVEGIRAMPLSQTATQKLGATLTIRRTAEGKLLFSPDAPTSPKALAGLKHPADLYAIEKFQIEHLGALKKAIYQKQLMKQLAIFKRAGIKEFGAEAFAGEQPILLGGRITPPPAPSPAFSPVVSVSLKPSVNIQTIMKQISTSPSPKPSVSISPYVSPSVSVSPSISPSISVSPSPSPSGSPSVSISPSPSPSPSVSVSPSPSPSVSVSPSPSPSPSVSPSPSPSPSPTPVPFIWGFPFPKLRGKKKKKKKLIEKILAKQVYSPTFTTKITGIKPITLTSESASKLLKQVQTGFELRPAVIVKRKVQKKRVKKKVKRKK